MPRRFPAPWKAQRVPRGYVVKDATGHSLAYVYARESDGQADVAKVLTLDEARRIASNIAKLPGFKAIGARFGGRRFLFSGDSAPKLTPKEIGGFGALAWTLFLGGLFRLFRRLTAATIRRLALFFLHPALSTPFCELVLADFAILVGINHFEVNDEWRGFVFGKGIALALGKTPDLLAFVWI
jgi:hypothetical protein